MQNNPYPHNGFSNNYNNRQNYAPIPQKRLKIYVGDMVQVVDPASQLHKKYGLVESIRPHDGSGQVTVKIGPNSNKFMFKQLRFCTRINNRKNDKKEVDKYIDSIDDNFGNR